ncbi:addiction module toxin RelE [Arthrobacter alpinus]|uniref:Addiction module toxin RelE n=1 Tax=Arthrobacter alpinus TaxID=656366 RepID=A0A0M3UH28_9MICC|nr:type II toxin-antitoxin system RelE/ParE family toxin [Arthrobacter alpinus]ALE93759.1 addiction module toxin RelE [Arthrobacter alpinus]
MAWAVEYDRDALKALKKLDKPVAAKIINYLDDVALLEDPRTQGKALTGNLAGLWRYRIGNYRVICDLIEDQLVIVAVDLGHRSDIYG